ncbi:MAG: hypothetical protein ACOZIN_14120 [Myxococcota bacterium]
MGSVFNRGTRDNRNWFVKFKDRDGVWKMVPSNQPTKELARQYLAQIESNIAAGKVGIQRTEDFRRCDDLMKQWAATITNRNAHEDRGRMAKHLLPVFGSILLPDVTLAVVMGHPPPKMLARCSGLGSPDGRPKTCRQRRCCFHAPHAVVAPTGRSTSRRAGSA